MKCPRHIVECWSQGQQFRWVCICRKHFRHMARWFREWFHQACICGEYFRLSFHLQLSCPMPYAAAILVSSGM